jgi:hypothetical protein
VCACAGRQDANVNVVALMNDTVAMLAAARYSNGVDSCVAAIIGTGAALSPRTPQTLNPKPETLNPKPQHSVLAPPSPQVCVPHPWTRRC